MVAVLPLDPDDPRQVGRYRLTGRLGEGGQGVVYLGEGQAGERVAVKILKTTDAAARARFAREMQAARQVAAFCTAAVLDSSADAPLPYVVSEFIDGPSLQQRVAERGPLRGGELERLAVNTASALAAIHGAGIVHRDLKPANVLLGPDGPRVVDFGIARAIDAETHTQLVGTPSYFAPEWLEGHPPTGASDVFAWAGTMVFAATGRPPFGPASSLPAVMHRIANGEPDLTGVPPTLYALLAECLAKDPSRRPTARDLMVRLVDPASGAAPGGPLPHIAQGPADTVAPFYADGPPTVRGSSRRGPLVAAGAVLAVAVAVAGIWLAATLLKDDDPGTGKNGSQAKSSSPTADPATSSGIPSTAASEGGIPEAFGGTWTGTITQPPGPGSPSGSSTDATVTLKAGGSTGQAVYKAWGCTMTLQVTKAASEQLDVTETAQGSGQGTKGFCIGGELSLKLAGGTLQYSSGSLAGTTTGTLRKSG